MGDPWVIQLTSMPVTCSILISAGAHVDTGCLADRRHDGSDGSEGHDGPRGDGRGMRQRRAGWVVVGPRPACGYSFGRVCRRCAVTGWGHLSAVAAVLSGCRRPKNAPAAATFSTFAARDLSPQGVAYSCRRPLQKSKGMSRSLDGLCATQALYHRPL